MPMKPETYSNRSDQFVQNYAHLLPHLQRFRPHYESLPDEEVGPVQKQQRIFAMLCLLASTNLEKGARLMGAKAKISYITCENSIMQAINSAPEDWLEQNEDALYDRGIIRGKTKFYIARPELLKGSEFARLRPQVPSAHQPIITDAIDHCYTSAKDSGWRPTGETMLYTVVQLLPDGPEKTAVLKDLRTGNKPNIHGNALTASAKGISLIVSQRELEAPLPTIDVGPKGDAGSLGKALALAATDQTPEDIKRQENLKELDRKLSLLAKSGKLTERQKVISLYIMTPKLDGTFQSDFAVVSRFVKGTSPGSSTGHLPLKMEEVRELRKLIPVLIDDLDKQMAQNNNLSNYALSR